jgi:hypothetical protein
VFLIVPALIGPEKVVLAITFPFVEGLPLLSLQRLLGQLTKKKS